MKRKPAPPSRKPEFNTVQQHLQMRPDNNAQANLSTEDITFDDIDQAIMDLQTQNLRNERSSSPIGQRNPLPVPPRPISASDFAGLTSTPSIRITGYQQNRATSGSAQANGIQSQQLASQSNPPILPTINSGEEMKWDYAAYGRDDEYDPFADGRATAPLNAHHDEDYHDTYAHPPGPPQQVFPVAQEDYSRTQTPYSYYGPSEAGTHLGPESTYPYYDTSMQASPERVSVYTRNQSLSPQDRYGLGYSLPMHRNAQGEVIVDRFSQDADAYASGTYSHIGRRQVRSRSATPMGDDEYMSVADNSADYSLSGHFLDPEKGVEELRPETMSQYVHVEREPSFNEKTPATEYPETPVTTQHYGPAPIGRVTRRHKQKKRVQLTNGNLVIDLNVPTKLVLPLKREDEMLKTRYTAVTCDPDDFEKNNFFLRQNDFGRTTELFIVITMFNVCVFNFNSKLRVSHAHEIFRKMKYYSVALLMVLCGIFRTFVHARIHRLGAKIPGKEL